VDGLACMELVTVELAAQSLGMEKAEFMASAIEYNIWVGVILGPNQIWFFNGSKLQKFLTRRDGTVNTEQLQPLYAEYPDPERGYMPVFENMALEHTDISIDNICVPLKEVDSIKRKVGRIRTYIRRFNLNSVQPVLGMVKIIFDTVKLFFGK
jgi:hypothetical protein